jgi:arylsulfatase A-like enzyme
MIDTLRADHLGCYGANVKTPVFDRLAEEGVLFERFSAAEDWTKPSCATMLTGLYPITHKAQTEDAVLSPDAPIISEELQKRGFATAAFISNAYLSESFGFKRGWNYYRNYLDEKRRAEHLFKEAAEWIENNKNRRFFAYIHTIDPHAPYTPPQEFLKLYDSKPYDGPIQPEKTHLQIDSIMKGKMRINERDAERLIALYNGEISYHDKCLGIFIQKLEEMNILKDTIIIVTADHGEEFGEHHGWGHGHSIYQELVHVPLVIYWKGVTPKGLRVSSNYDHSVIFPTIFDALGLETLDYLEGVSILPIIFNNFAVLDVLREPRAGFSSHKDERMAVWSQNLKLQVNKTRWRFKTFLYDLEKDPDCQIDFSKQQPIALWYMKILLGLFMGAEDKRFWKSSKMIKKEKLKLRIKKLEWDDELRKLLEGQN